MYEISKNLRKVSIPIRGKVRKAHMYRNVIVHKNLNIDNDWFCVICKIWISKSNTTHNDIKSYNNVKD